MEAVLLATAAVASVAVVLWLLLGRRKRGDGLEKVPLVPGSHWLLGHLPWAFTHQLHEMLLKAAKVAPVTKIDMFVLHWAVVSDPALSKRVFVNSSQRNNEHERRIYESEDVFSLRTEEEWRPERRRLNPFFGTTTVNAMFQHVHDSATNTMARIQRLAGKGYIDGEAVIMRAVMDSLVRCVFSREFDEDKDNERMRCIKALNDSVVANFIENIPILRNVWNPFKKTFSKNQHRLLELSADELERRRAEIAANKTVPQDLLTNLLVGKSPEPLDPEPTAKQNIDHTLAFFFAGLDTTSNSLLFAVYELCRHRDIMAKATAEVDQVFADWDRKTLYVNQLVYLDKVLKEAARLHPVTVGTTRLIHTALDLDTVTLPPRTFVFLNGIGMGRDPKHWERPDDFYPEHFDPEAVTARDTGAYMPFGGGARACIGFKLALLEQRVLLAHLLHNFDLELEPMQDHSVITGLTTHFAHPLKLKFTPRQAHL